MNPRHADYQVVPYAEYRQVLAAAYRSAQYKPFIHGLIEMDVTRARTVLGEHRAKTGESLSFTAFLATCLAKAVDEHKAVQAFRRGSKRLVLFNDVDIYLIIEHGLAGQKYIIPYIIRAANRKTVREMHRDIRAAQGADVHDLLKRFWPLLLPTALYRPFVWVFVRIARRYPRLWKQTMGTVGITSVDMFGNGAG